LHSGIRIVGVKIKILVAQSDFATMNNALQLALDKGGALQLAHGKRGALQTGQELCSAPKK
jgi:hypothetical protein